MPDREPTRRASHSVGLFGLFDVDSLDVQLRVRVAVHELARRRPDVGLRLFAPFGTLRPIAVAADLAVEPLAPLTAARRAALASELAAMIAIDDGDLDRESAYTGHPSVDPRDIGVVHDLFAAPPDGLVVGRDPQDPHPALLARRVWPYGVCEQRREFLRAMHWWPQRGAATVVAVCEDDRAHVAGLAAKLGDRELTVMSTSSDDACARNLAESVGKRAHFMPSSHSSMDDRVAAVAGATVVVTDSAAVLALADAYARPRRPINGQRAARRSEATFRRDEAALDEHFDGLAALTAGSVVSELEPGEVAALRSALDAQARRVAHERVVLADYVRAVRNNAAQEAATLHAELEHRPSQRVRDALRRRRG